MLTSTAHTVSSVLCSTEPMLFVHIDRDLVTLDCSLVLSLVVFTYQALSAFTLMTLTFKNKTTVETSLIHKTRSIQQARKSIPSFSNHALDF